MAKLSFALIRLPGIQRLWSPSGMHFVALLVVAFFLIAVPVLALVMGSLWSVPPGAEGGSFTVAAYAELLGSFGFWKLMCNSLLIGIGTACVAGVIGLTLAWLFVSSDLPGTPVWINLLTIPLYLSPLMLSLAWIALAAPRVGFINAVWHHWTGTGGLFNVYSVAFMIWILASHYSPYVFLSLIGPLRAMDGSLEEASLTLGSGGWRTFGKVTLPLLWPALLASGIMVTILAAENFAVPALLGRSIKFSTVPSEIYFWLSFEPTQPNLAATAGTVFLLLSLAGVMLYRRVIRHAERYRTMVGKPMPARRVRLAGARPLVVVLLVIYFLVAVVIPLLALLVGSLLSYMTPDITWSSFTLANYRQAFRGTNLKAFYNSMILSVGSATALALLGALIAYAAMRGTSKFKGSLDYLSLTGATVPGIVLGVGMLWTYVGLPLAIYGTIWILFIAYIARFLGHAVRTCGSSLLPISSEFEEAAQMLGQKLGGRLRRIVLPLMAPGLASAWILMFIFTLSEVSATIILYSPSTMTLSVLAWQSMQMYGAMQGFAFMLVQASLIFVALGFMTWLLKRLGNPSNVVIH